MQSMLWLLHILLQISMFINFVHLETTHPNIHFKWWRKRHNSNAHKHLIDEMSPGQLSRLQEEYNDNKIPLRHEKPEKSEKFPKLNQVMCSRFGGCDASSVKKAVERREVDTTSQKNHEQELESKLHNTRKYNHEPVVEDSSDFAAAQANRSHWQEIEKKKQNADELSPWGKRKMELAGNPTVLYKRFQELYSTELPVIANLEEEKRLSRLADRHFNQMIEETRCKTPKPIIVRVLDVYRHPHKFYVPQCTKLFQCTEKSGCCTEPRSCMTHKTENVTLYFKVHTQVKGKGEVITVEALTFQNDTECTCKKMTTPSPPKNDSDWENLELEPQDESRSECNCPAPYSKRTMSDGTCICDCFYDDIQCLSHKNGETKMKWSEIRCVREGKCTKPTCERGVYSVKSGKCPITPRYKWQT